MFLPQNCRPKIFNFYLPLPNAVRSMQEEKYSGTKIDSSIRKQKLIFHQTPPDAPINVIVLMKILEIIILLKRGAV
ncbi:MAG TPA: hypothetical protein PLD26_05295 [Smithella sp.]|jgi:hypothetical protein|nr:hypothetical protein [Smithella sp.]